jgi:TPR repeat protein
LDNSRLINSGETKYSVPLTSGDQKLLLTDSKPTNDTGEVALKEGPVEVETLSGPSRDVTSESRMAYGPQSAESRSALEQQFEQQDASIVQLNTDQLLVRAGQLIELDDVASARLVYQLAALRGSAAAASALGGTYDPVQLSKLRIREIRPDPTQAIRWYRKAIDLGDQSALVKLGELATWLQQEAARETARSK